MKKVMRFALMALLIFPLMTGCKTKNPAEDPSDSSTPADPPQEEPKTEEEIFEEWITPTDTTAPQSFSEQGLIGLWRLDYQAQIQKGQTEPFWAWHASVYSDDSTFFEINGNKTITEYGYYAQSTESGAYIPMLNKVEGTWQFTAPDKWTVAFKIYSEPDNYTILILEENRLVYYEEFPNAETGVPDLWYYGFTRAKTLPPAPERPVDRLTKYSWKVTSDTIDIYDVIRTEKADGIYYDEKFVERKVNQMPANCVFTFDFVEHLLNITDQSGNIISQYKTFDEDLSLSPIYTGFIQLEHIKGEFLLPGGNIVFNPNLDDPKKAYFFSQYTKTTYDEKLDKDFVQNLYYHINTVVQE